MRVPLSTHSHYVRVRWTWLTSHTPHTKSKGAIIHTFSSRESAVHLAGQQHTTHEEQGCCYPHILITWECGAPDWPATHGTQEEQQYLDRTSHTTTPAWPATHHTRSARVPLSTHFHYVRVRCTWLASHASHKKCKGAFIYTISSRESAVHLIGQPHIIYEEQGCHYPHILITWECGAPDWPRNTLPAALDRGWRPQWMPGEFHCQLGDRTPACACARGCSCDCVCTFVQLWLCVHVCVVVIVWLCVRAHVCAANYLQSQLTNSTMFDNSRVQQKHNNKHFSN